MSDVIAMLVLAVVEEFHARPLGGKHQRLRAARADAEADVALDVGGDIGSVNLRAPYEACHRAADVRCDRNGTHEPLPGEDIVDGQNLSRRSLYRAGREIENV